MIAHALQPSAMRTLNHMPELTIPPAMRRWADCAQQHPAVHSVILFGSRAHGTARPDSDWDLALIVSPGSEQQISQADIADDCYEWAPAHGAIVVAEDQMLRDGMTYATIASEIASGVVLDGMNYELDTQMTNSHTPQASQQYCTMMPALWEEVCAETEMLKTAIDTDLTWCSAGLGKHSADAAEFAVKLLCLSLGVSFGKKHDVIALAQNVPSEWRDTVLALNGHTHNLHKELYGDVGIASDEVPRKYDESKAHLLSVLSLIEKLADMQMPLSDKDLSDMRNELIAKHTVFSIRMKQAQDAVPDIVDAAMRTRCAVFNAIGIDREEPDRQPNSQGIGERE